MNLYHVTSEKLARRYRESCCIKHPVRGFTTLQAAMAWAMKSGRKIIYEVSCDNAMNVHKLPDHQNRYGEAWWIDEDVTAFKCVFSADKDA